MRRYQELAFRVAYVIVGSAEEAEEYLDAALAKGVLKPAKPTVVAAAKKK